MFAQFHKFLLPTLLVWVLSDWISVCILFIDISRFLSQIMSPSELTSSWFSKIILPTWHSVICHCVICALKCNSMFLKYSVTKIKPRKCRRFYFYFCQSRVLNVLKTCLFWLLWMCEVGVFADEHLFAKALKPCFFMLCHNNVSCKQTRHLQDLIVPHLLLD